MTSDDRDTAIDQSAATARSGSPPDRLSLPDYEIRHAIGKGGMGEVLLAHDIDIGRDVAIKRMATAEPAEDEIRRFLREARIQALLEHPAIVPVHAIGKDAKGRPYFTMKRLSGRTLHQVIGDGSATQQRLLRALVDVCNAVQLAHENGVIHRDLKPSNIMLGDHGEVYVLDWGVARVTGERETILGNDRTLESGETAAGSLLGTAGYMAPEQIHDATRVGPAADVYSLGAVLFEILTGGDPLHPRRATEAIANTLEGTVAPPSARAANVPPELDALCLEAITREPSQRPTARALGARIEKYLDGDRDLERRRTLAAELVAQAREAKVHAEAMRLAGRAVGLDPDSPEAPALVAQLLLAPPAEDPPELVKQFEEYDHRISLEGARLGSSLFFAVFALIVPFMVWVGVRDWTVIGALIGVAILNAVTGVYQIVMRRPNDVVALVLVLVFSVVISRVSGPYVVGPALISGVMINLGAQAMFLKRPRWVLISLVLIAFFLPIALEQIGVFAHTTHFDRDGMSVASRALDLVHGDRVVVLLCLTYAGILTAAGSLSMKVGGERRAAQRDTMRRTWHLEKLARVESSSARIENSSVRA